MRVGGEGLGGRVWGEVDMMVRVGVLFLSYGWRWGFKMMVEVYICECVSGSVCVLERDGVCVCVCVVCVSCVCRVCVVCVCVLVCVEGDGAHPANKPCLL